jgi:hypothetical protein
MIRSSDNLVVKLNAIAPIIDAEKPQLRLLALVHRDNAPHDRWDLLVSSDQLVPWSVEAISYIVGLLKKELTVEDMIRIARVVALPTDNALVNDLLAHDSTVPWYPLSALHPMDRFDDPPEVIWPRKNAMQTAQAG